VFCIYLRTNSDLCHLQHKLIGFYNRDEKCLQRGTEWVFESDRVSSLKFNMATMPALFSQRTYDGLESHLVLLRKMNPVPTFWGSKPPNPLFIPKFSAIFLAIAVKTLFDTLLQAFAAG
jgi:hypothetical protein